MSNDSQQIRRQFIWGILIICMGVMFLMSRNDWVELSQLWRYWPVVVILFGINNMIPPTNGKRFVEGLSQVAFACWFWAALEQMWGLTLRNSWPVLIIIGGAGLILQPIVIKYFDQKKEEN